MNDSMSDPTGDVVQPEARKTRSAVINAFEIEPGVLEFRQSGAVLDVVHMNRIPHEVQNRYAIEGFVRAYQNSDADLHGLMLGEKLPKRVPPEVKKAADGPSKAAIKAAAIRDAAKAKYEAALHRAAELGAPPPE
jgi:hypothetical protein